METEKWRLKLAWLMLIAVFAPVVFLLLAFAVLQIYQGIANARYAEQVFDDTLDVEHVVASKKYHGTFTAFGCSYAIVRVSPKQARGLAEQGPNGVDGQRVAKKTFWPARWTSTPFPIQPKEVCAEGGPAVPCCLHELEASDQRVILQGLSATSGWYGTSSEHVAFILPDQRLVGVVRYGD